MVMTMRYRITCYTEWEDSYVFCGDKDTANMLFGILAQSKEFAYITLEEAVERYDTVKEWVDDQA
jgi:hypothetical protein